MEAIGLIVAVGVAVGGWIVNGVLARRAARRELRVTYLLSAYRALGNASNRSPMSRDQERGLESAIEDIMLLGNDVQMRLAVEFAEAFVADGGADTDKLLEALRQDLRRELLLGKTAERRQWLRIEPGRQWFLQAARVRASVAAADSSAWSGPTTSSRPEEPPLTDGLARAESIRAAFSRVEEAIVTRYPQVGADPAGRKPADIARNDRLVTPASAQAIEGLAVMRDLACSRPDRLGAAEVEEFATLASALAYAIRTENVGAGAHPS